MQLSKQTRQIIGAVIGAAIASAVSTGLAIPSVDRQPLAGQTAAVQPAR